jgi:hypothetical protein
MTSKSYLVVAAVLVAGATITLTRTVGVDAVLSPVARLPPWKPSNPPELNEQSCWRPGMGRNIGISELSCDAVGRASPADRWWSRWSGVSRGLFSAVRQ